MSKSTKEVKHNKATDKAGLSFNVNVTRNWLKKQLVLGGETMPKIRGAHIGLTAIVESLLMNIFNLVNAHLPKEKSSLYKVTLPALAYPLQLDTDFAILFKEHIANFQKSQDVNYSDSFCVSKSAMNTYIEKQYGDNIQLDPKAYNLLTYLLLTYSVNITRTAQYLMRYAGKKTIEAEAFKTAVLIHTPETISNTIIMKLDDAMKNNVDIEKDSDGESDGEEDSDKKTKKKTSKEKDEDHEDEPVSDSEDDKASKKSAKKSTKEVSEDEESDNEADKNDSDNDSEDEPVVETKKSGKKNSKKEKKPESEDSDSEHEEKEKETKKKKKAPKAKKE